MRGLAIGIAVIAIAIGAGAKRHPANPADPAPAAALANSASPVVSDGLDPPHSEAGTITIPRTWGGHFFVSGDVAGKPLRFVVDTGATSVALSKEDARNIGLDVDHLDYDGQAQTASGTTRVASVTLPRLRIGDIQLMDVRASVLEGAPAGMALLGQSFLGRIDKVSIEGDNMTLTKL